jgi:hypothetical protein
VRVLVEAGIVKGDWALRPLLSLSLVKSKVWSVSFLICLFQVCFTFVGAYGVPCLKRLCSSSLLDFAISAAELGGCTIT